MMTPEQVQRTIDFILSSHAESAVRMDRLEEAQKRAEQEDEHLRVRLNALVKVTHDLLRVSRIQNNRLKRLESESQKNE